MNDSRSEDQKRKAFGKLEMLKSNTEHMLNNDFITPEEKIKLKEIVTTIRSMMIKYMIA